MGAPVARFGKCCCTACTRAYLADAWLNATRVADYASTGMIPPYPRLNATPGTDCAYPDGLPIACGDSGQPLCGVWPRADFGATGCPDDTWQDWNCYSDAASGTPQSRTVWGHKKVQAVKQWHGRKPWDGNVVCASGCQPETDRYRTVERTFRVLDDSVWNWHVISMPLTSASGIYDYEFAPTGGHSRIFTVAKDSGVVSLDACVANYSEVQPSPFGGPLMNLTTRYKFGAEEMVSILFGTVLCDSLNYPTTPPYSETIQAGSSGATDTYAFDGYVYKNNNPEDIKLRYISTTEEAVWTEDLTISATEAIYTYTVEGVLDYYLDEYYEPYSGQSWISGSGYFGYEFRWLLSNPYTAATLYSDTVTLLDEWDLQDHLALPFRTDGWLALAPLVGRDEYVARDPDLGNVDCQVDDGSGLVSWWDSATQTSVNGVRADIFSGRIRGKPFPQSASGAWPDWSWDLDHETWRRCMNSPDPTLVPYIYSYGARNWDHADTNDPTDAVIPTTAAWWQNNKIAGELRSHAWVSFDGYSMRAQKSAEVLSNTTPAFDYFRPCGSDRWRMDVTTAHCIASYADDYPEPGVTTIWITGDLTADWTVGTLIVFYGENSYSNQIRPVATADVDSTWTRFTFGAALSVPTEYVAAVVADWFTDPTNATQYGLGIAGKLRWQETVGLTLKPWQRVICGRVNVTVATNTVPVSVTVSEETELVDGDQVTIAGCGGNTAANGDWSITRVSRTQFTLDASTGNGTYSGGGTCTSKSGVGSVSNGLPDVTLHSRAHTGDYVEQVWLPDNETGGPATGATNTQRRLTGACPILTITPNADLAATGQNIPFPNTVDLTTCGAVWAARFATQLIDQLWQQPIVCEGVYGGCPELVEARIAYPAGAASGTPANPPFNLDPNAPASAGWVEGSTTMTPNEIVTPWNPCEAVI